MSKTTGNNRPSSVLVFCLAVIAVAFCAFFLSACGGKAKPIDKKAIDQHQQEVEDENQDTE